MSRQQRINQARRALWQWGRWWAHREEAAAGSYARKCTVARICEVLETGLISRGTAFADARADTMTVPEWIEATSRAVDRLSVEQRLAVRFRYLDALPDRYAALRMGVPLTRFRVAVRDAEIMVAREG